MRPIDAEKLPDVWRAFRESAKDCRRIALLSSNDFEVSQVKLLFPGATVLNLSRESWDLNEPAPEQYDLVVACNVFMYSPNPELWFRNVLSSCKHFWLLDNIRALRMQDSELGDDGDSARFYFTSGEQPRIREAFCLDRYMDRVLGFFEYVFPMERRPGDPNAAFILHLRGDLVV